MTREERKAFLIRAFDTLGIDSVPMPDADEFCHGTYNIDNKCCTLGWAGVTLGTKPYLSVDFEGKNLKTELARFILGDESETGVHPIEKNDSTPKPILAMKWRERMGELGFDTVVDA